MTARALLLSFLLLPALAHAHSQVRSPVNCVSVDVGNPGSGWTNPDRAQTSNNQVATATVNDDQATDALVCDQYGFTIPAGATIFGIIVRLERRTSATAGVAPTTDALLRIIKNGVAEPAERATATAYTTADVVEDHGTATDLWGTTWTAADINNANFGAGFTAQKAGTAGGVLTVSVDHMAIEVFYSQPPPAPTLASPANGASVNTTTPTFSWNAAVDGDGDTVTYDIQVDDSGCGFASPEFSQTGIAGTSAVSSPLPNATYCWRVRAVDEHGIVGAWSATRDVTVNAGVATSTTASPGNCVSQDVGNPNWGNPDRAATSNNQVATATVTDNQATDYLVCTQYGFAIPAGATILGIVISVERRASSVVAPTRDASMRVLKAGTAQAAERATTTSYTTADVVEDHGGATDLWGTTWTAADINNANFGARFQAQKVGTAGGNITVSVDHVAITVYWSEAAVVTTPGSFNAFETATAAGAITGVIRTKVAGAGFSLDVVAISGGAQMAGFSNTVSVELLGNTNLGVALDAQNCPTSSTVVQTLSPAITAGRSTVAFGAVGNAWRDVRVRVSYPAGAPTVISCSTDNFAIRPASFGLAASDSDWETAGGGRALNNTGASGGNVHKAGRPFRLTVTPAPAGLTNYAGSPTLSALACTLPAGCANGTLSLGAFGGAGTRVSDSTYDEVGAFDLTLVDQTFADVDILDTAGDCAGRYVCQSAAAAVGRFVPDHFAFSVTTAPQFRTFDALDGACSVPAAGPRRSFTYVGQPFGYVTAPVAQVVAQNAANGTTTNYRGMLFKLTANDLSQTFVNAPVKPITATLQAPAISAVGNGVATYTASNLDKIAFDRDPAVASAPFNASISLGWAVSDATENAVVGQGIIGTTAFSFAAIGFDSGDQFRYGRLRLANANGSQLVPLPVPMETQYWGFTNPPLNTVSGWITNTADNCTVIGNNNVAMSGFSGNLAACETAIGSSGPFSGGRRMLMLAAPGGGNDGAVTLTANLGAAVSGTTCTVVGGATVNADGANRTYLQGNWTGAPHDDNPSARAAFGVFRGAGEVIYMRENF